MQNNSLFDPSRKTVGQIYREAQLQGERGLITGDMNYELRKSLVVDLNETVERGSKEFKGKLFYITVYEKRDLQMKNAFIRKLIKTRYRPYPEADTHVYKVIPSGNEVYFCWSLPPRYEMINMLNTPEIRTEPHEQEELRLFRHWENFQLEHFGFCKNDIGNWIANKYYDRDRLISKSNPDDKNISMHNPMKNSSSSL